MVAELRGGICILGRRFHLVRSFRAVFILRGRMVVVGELRGGIHNLGHRFQVQSPRLGSLEGGIFQV